MFEPVVVDARSCDSKRSSDVTLTSEAPVATPELVLPAPEEELHMAATLAAVEPAASRRRRSVDPRRTRMAAVYLQ
jgi:hypothetical protein